MTGQKRHEPKPRVSERLEGDIERLIATRKLRPGSRLPSERALSEQFQASRASLREAIGQLAARGVVAVHKTGLVVAEPLPKAWITRTVSEPLSQLVAEHAGYGHDVMEIRYALEGAASYHAALRADEAARAKIAQCLHAMDAAHGKTDPMQEASLDAAFHLAIAEASNNAILYQVMSSLFGLLQASISESLEKLYLVPSTYESLSQQHQAIFNAIEAGNGDAARAASDTHLRFVETTIRRIDDDLARKSRASVARASRKNTASGETR